MMKRKQLRKVLLRFLQSKGYVNIKQTDKYILAEGGLPVCLVAHIDTVWPKPPSRIYHDKDYNVFWSETGLGADDRAGIYMIIELVERGLRPSIVITDLEEEGGVGADVLVRHFPRCPFKECKALIELDRRGYNDAVFYRCDNKEFKQLILSYGFKLAQGTFTDISIISPPWGLASVNLSCGYYNEHTSLEMLKLEECEQVIDKVELMLRECDNWKSYEYIPEKMKIFDKSWTQEVCLSCGKRINYKDAHRVGGNGLGLVSDFYLCSSCYQMYVSDFID